MCPLEYSGEYTPKDIVAKTTRSMEKLKMKRARAFGVRRHKYQKFLTNVKMKKIP